MCPDLLFERSRDDENAHRPTPCQPQWLSILVGLRNFATPPFDSQGPTMKTLEYTVGFDSPAFLGNAQQVGQWRTPPFKALLREWWRIVTASKVEYDHEKLLVAEKVLFGAAGEDGQNYGRSQVQLRLSNWEQGKLRTLPNMRTHEHPEVHRWQTAQLRPVDTAVYLGFGPVTNQRSSRVAIWPDTRAVLRLQVPEEHAPDIKKAMQLASWFGAMGSRSRNGWGGLRIEADGMLDFSQMDDSELSKHASCAPLADCLRRDWPHAVGQSQDGRLAVWRVQSPQGGGFGGWSNVLEEIAAIKIKLRTHFKFEGGQPHQYVQERHVFGYPVTRHSLQGLQKGRLASQLRFRVVRQSGQGADRFLGAIVHLPCAMPEAFFGRSGVQLPNRQAQEGVWLDVHQMLDQMFPASVVRSKSAAA